ncbi:hypothetical protein OB919_09570 [Halobacteria archaeon AArc-curdl1]|uniref:DUF2975 domain-containing protein n=1 Tax=Natronosalvus hydrolyticus TaxID=2979988 RepID=A0AAP3E694_9EURY|nr:hypothetical protein [Halobacteria archaeon AArc-curdl1]
MATQNRSLVIPSLVYLGAAILVGIPVTVLLHTGVLAVADALGYESVFEQAAVSLLVLGLSLLIGLQLAVEAAAIQLGGLEALNRGSPRVALFRYVLLTVGVFLALAAATWVGLSTAFAGFGPTAIALGLLVGLAGLVVLYRSTRAFVDGLTNEV